MSMRWTFGMAFWAATIMAPAANAEPPVDLELVIAVDTSGSIDDIEASLQRQGYVHAFRHPAIMEAIKRGRHGAIAVTYMEWAGDHHQQILVPWKLINSAASALDFAAALAFEPLMISVWTSISGAIRGGMQAFADSPYRAERRVIDISGDGANNDGEIVTRARDRAVAKGYIINGLPIVNDRPSRYGRRQIPNLDFYYTDCVVGGPGAFIIVANGFDDYARAVHRKLILEIAGLAPENTPEPRPAIIPAAGEGRPPCTIGEILRQHWDDL